MITNIIRFQKTQLESEKQIGSKCTLLIMLCELLRIVCRSPIALEVGSVLGPWVKAQATLLFSLSSPGEAQDYIQASLTFPNLTFLSLKETGNRKTACI